MTALGREKVKDGDGFAHILALHHIDGVIAAGYAEGAKHRSSCTERGFGSRARPSCAILSKIGGAHKRAGRGKP
jgi:hypothetical protein